MNNFKLPKEWWVNASTKEENIVLTDWCNKNLEPKDYMNDYFSSVSNTYTYKFHYNSKIGKEITFQQFEHYVLNKSNISNEEDYSCITILLKKLNIQ